MMRYGNFSELIADISRVLSACLSTCSMVREYHKIVTTFLTMDESNPKYTRFVPNEEIQITNEYNLWLNNFIEIICKPGVFATGGI